MIYSKNLVSIEIPTKSATLIFFAAYTFKDFAANSVVSEIWRGMYRATFLTGYVEIIYADEDHTLREIAAQS